MYTINLKQLTKYDFQCYHLNYQCNYDVIVFKSYTRVR